MLPFEKNDTYATTSTQVFAGSSMIKISFSVRRINQIATAASLVVPWASLGPVLLSISSAVLLTSA